MQARRLSPQPRSDFQILLRIRHPSLDPTLISRELRLQAEHSFRAGEARESTAALASSSVHAESCWLGSLYPAQWLTGVPWSEEALPGAARSLQAQAALAFNLSNALSMCCSHLARHAAFFQRLQSEAAQIDLRIELSAASLSGFTLAPAVTRALGQLGIAVEFELAEP
jgi:hypothetical protein